MNEQFIFDIFFSHGSKDKAVVWTLAERFKPGNTIPAKIEEWLEHLRVLVFCMSANAFGSDWAQLKTGAFRFRDPLNQSRRLHQLAFDTNNSPATQPAKPSPRSTGALPHPLIQSRFANE